MSAEDEPEPMNNAERAEMIEFSLKSTLLMADGDLMVLLENASDLDENGQVPGKEDDNSPFKAGFQLFRQISLSWKEQGRPRYVLSASMASLMVSTKAPEVTEETLSAPYDAFVLEVPGEWTSLPGVGPLTILLVRIELPDDTRGLVIVAARRFQRLASSLGDTRRLGVDLPDACIRVVIEQETLSESTVEARLLERFYGGALPAYFTEAVRYLVNTCCLITAHNECAVRRTGKNTPKAAAIHDVRPPEDVAVSADFRRYALSLIANRRIAERKDALLHIVRGHWKRQVKGSARAERALIWIRPYQRGADSLGRIVEKTINVGEA